MVVDIKLATFNMLLSGAIDRYFTKCQKDVFVANPFAELDDPALLLAVRGDEVLGSVFTFPLEISLKSGRLFKVCAGSTLFVNPKSRGMGIGSSLTIRRLQLTKDKIAIASGLSGMSLPIFKKKGFDVFPLKRYIFLKNSRPVIEMFFTRGYLVKIGTIVTNCFVSLWRLLLQFQVGLIYKGLSVIEILEATQEVEDIVNQDKSLFRENHTKEWFNWVLKGGFVDDYRSKQHLFLVKDEEKTIAFFMTKERFHKEASHRGFKNVILGSVIEWGILENIKLTENQLLLLALLSFGKHVDAVEICSAYDSINRFLKHRLLIQVGESNFAIKAADDSPLQQYPEYHKQGSWRIRPAASDNSFD